MLLRLSLNSSAVLELTVAGSRGQRCLAFPDNGMQQLTSPHSRRQAQTFPRAMNVNQKVSNVGPSCCRSLALSCVKLPYMHVDQV